MIKGVYMDKHNIYEIDGNAAKKNLSIEQKKSQSQSMEMMQAVQEEQEEKEINIPLFMLKKNTNNKHWHYIDLEEHDAEVIRAERKRVYNAKRKRKMQKEIERQVKLENLMYFVKQKFIGIMFLIISVVLVKSGLMYDVVTGMNDGTFLMFIIPLGLFLVFTKNRCFYDYDYDYDSNNEDY